MIRCTETPEHIKDLHYMEQPPEAFARYVLDRAIASAKSRMDELNEDLRKAALNKKGVKWDEYHSMAITNIFELKRVIRAFGRIRDCVEDFAADFYDPANASNHTIDGI